MLRVLNICDTPLAFYYQRQSKTINEYHNGQYWRYYYDDYSLNGCQFFLDLGPFSSRTEINSALENIDAIIYHGTRNYRKPLYFRNGTIKGDIYAKNKDEIILIHGRPETQAIRQTNRFIEKHRNNIKFYVATPNQLHLFQNTRLLPIVGQFSGSDLTYKNRENYLEFNKERRIIRRSKWKAAEISKTLIKEMGLTNELIIKSPYNRIREIGRNILGQVTLHESLPRKKLKCTKNGLNILFDNVTKWQNIFDLMADLKQSDILLENDIHDYPGGGTNHTLGIEAMSLGVASFNAMTEANSQILSDWLNAKELPPLPNWKNDKHYREESYHYLNRMLYDEDFLIALKKKSRVFFKKYLDPNRIVPRLIRTIEGEEN
jgi:hypothetical protein